ncbi:MAG TPA: efflux RND transporter periplasmic adaptor subunit [Planctomycetota bacterium]|nr:efflux RND transporter periplasmic adaptor subunit [Planctomycetota bacterium]
MNDRHHPRRSTRRQLGHLLLGSMLLALLCASCSDADPDAPSDEHATGDGHAGGHDDHEGAEPHGTAGDVHHASEHAQACEEDVTLTAEAVTSSGIRIEPARTRMLTGLVHAPARVSLRTDGLARIGSPFHGRVIELPVKLGDRVERGAVVLVAECPEYGEAQADFLQKTAQSKALAPAVELAKSTWERARSLLESIQGVTLTEVQRREAEYREAERDLAFARAAAAAAGSRLALFGFDEQAIASLEQQGRVQQRLPIRAPLAGQVIKLDVTLGELVGPEKDALLVLADTRRLWILAHVPESRLGEIVEGSKAQITVAALGITDLVGTVAAIAPTLDAETRNAEVRIEVDNADGRLRPGMFAQATIHAAPRGSVPVLVVPDGAVQTVEGKSSVFVPVDANGLTFCRHAVRVDEPVDGDIPVLAGLREGELIAVSGTFVLKAELGKGEATHDH